MRVGSLFSGVGGFDLAAEAAGMTVAWQSEKDPHASKVLDYHWPHVPNLGDIHDITNPPAVDVLTGGFPCQDYSVAGNREGLAGDRGALWWEYHRLIDELRPTWVVGENVPGILSSRSGRDFETIIGSLTELGYGVAWAVLDAQYWGVAQRRRRVFIVGHSGGIPRPEVLALGEGLSGNPAPSREAGPAVAALTRSGLGGGGPDDNLAQAGHVVAATLTQGAPSAGRRNEDDVNLVIAQCVTTGTGIRYDPETETLIPAVHGVRRLTVTECERLQGFPDHWTATPGNSDTQRYRQLGNAVAVPVAEYVMRRIKEAL